MTVIPARSAGLGLPVWAAAVVFATALLGHLVLAAPPAVAECTLTAEDDQYIKLLAQKNLIHGADFNDCHMVAEGRWFADQVRNSPDPLGTARSLAQMVTDTTPLNKEQAEWEVESAIFVYAPEMIPQIKDQCARENAE